MWVVGVAMSNKYLPTLFLIILVVTSLILRFQNLGYSDYISDETTVMSYFKNTGSPHNLSESSKFLVSQRKGPMQFFVAYLPFFFTDNVYNEYAFRIPFAFMGLLSVIVFYLFLLKLFKNPLIAFVSAMIFSVNGFVVAFSRIVQYQSLNMLFSFLALYFYADLLDKNKNILKSTLLGTVFFCFSLLSHWDAVFYIPLMAYFIVRFLKNLNYSRDFKIKILLYNLLLSILLLVPFLLPFLINFSRNAQDRSYFTGRLGLSLGQNARYYLNQLLFTFELYNPFYTFRFLISTSLIGILFSKKSRIFFAWFLILILAFLLFVKSPGTHVYNLLIPMIILSGIGVEAIVSKFPNFLKAIPLAFAFVIIGFLYHQSYLIFVDNRVEYPWSVEKIFGNETKEYSHKNLTNNIIGFPLNRYWSEINDFINDQNRINEEQLSYTTNEVKAISNFYMDSEHKSREKMYAIGIKAPLSFRTDYKFPQIKGKRTVHKIKNEYGRTVVTIFLVEPK